MMQNMSSSISIFLILWLAGRASADGGDDFANNLASDLGPIIALFGERVVMQFMSQAMGIADCILLAVAPIGAITTVVSAIRVAGPAWLKSFIGRARETLITAELEVMTSTSEEVCELWNGHSVVRCPGSADIYQFICLIPNGYDNHEKLSKIRPNIRYKTLKDWNKGGSWNGWSEIKVTGPTYIRLCFEKARTLFTVKLSNIYQQLTAWSISSSLRRRWRDPESGNFEHGSIVDLELPSHTSSTWYISRTDLDKGIPRKNSVEVAPKNYSRQGDSEDIIVLIDHSDYRAPNILLNCNDKTGRGELYLATAFGVILQLGALVYFGFITYYGPTQSQFLKNGKLAVGYAFPSAAIGTILLVFGLFICAWVVGESTTESHYGAEGYQLFIVWLQKHHDVNDQIFRPYAMYPTRREYITLSRRNPSLYNKNIKDPVTGDWSLKFLTCFAALISLVGFVSQFIGMRGLNWTASVVQLGITILVTMIRAIVRRGFGKPPASVPLKSNFELEWFALSLGDLATAPWATVDGRSTNRSGNDASKMEISPKWSIQTGGKQAYRPLEIDHKAATAQRQKNSIVHQAVITRLRLKNLSGWKSAVSDEASRLSRAIETVANTFLEKLHRGTPMYLWVIPATYGKEEDCVYIKLKRRDGRWRVKEEKIEAILSLWLYSAPWAEFSKPSEQRSLRLYGPSHFKDKLSRDLGWWMPELVPQMFTRSKDAIDELKSSGCTVVGFTSESHGGMEGPNEHEEETGPVDEYLGLECEDTQERLFSRDLFFSFMRAIANMPGVTIPSASSVQQMDYSKMTGRWEEMELRNDIISSLARKLERTGLGTPSDIFFDLIVPLSLEKKLTNLKNVIGEATKQAHEYERSRQWKKLVDTCSCLLDLAKQFDIERESSGPLALAVCLEFLHRLRHEAVLQESEGRGEEELATQLDILEAKFVDERFAISTRFSRPMRSPTDEWHYAMSFNILIGSAPDSNWPVPDSFGIVSEHIEILDENKKDAERTVYWDSGVLDKVDAFGWSPLHYAASLQSHNLRIVFPETGEVLNVRDLMGWTPLQHACLHGNKKVVNLLLDHDAPIEVGGYDGVTPLHCAVRSGNLDILEQLVEKIKSGRQKHTRKGIAHVDRNERYPIHWAAVKGDTELVRLLKDDINLTDRFGWTCTHLAAVYGHTALIEYIIKDCVTNLNTGDNDSRTPLYLATENKSLEAVKVLFKAGADINAKAKDGSTPLHKAVNQEDIARLLLIEGADIGVADIEGRTPLYQALAHGATDVAALLIELGADISIAAKDGRTPLHMAVKHRDIAQKLIKKGAYIEAIDIEGHTPLCLAAADGTAEVAALLIDEHANVATPTKDGRTPLHMALSRGEDGLDIAKRLLYFGSKPRKNPYSNATAKGGVTPLHIAAEYGPPEAIDILLKLGANINSTDEYGQTALLISIYQENWDIAEFLLGVGADVKADNRDGYTPLLGAVLGGQEGIVERLLGAGVDFDAADEDGYSSIHLAVSRGRFGILRQLLKADANIDAVNKLNHQTPLHIAVRRGDTGMVQILLESQANTELFNHLNFSPLQYALYRGDLEIVEEFAWHDKFSTAGPKATLQRGKDGDTPLHTLCRWTHSKADEQTMCKMLDKLLIVASEIDLNAKNDDGYTPLDLAIAMATEYREFIYKLEAKGAKPGSEESGRRFKAWKNMKPNEGSSSA